MWKGKNKWEIRGDKNDPKKEMASYPSECAWIKKNYMVDGREKFLQ